jgi:hypothetical protein
MAQPERPQYKCNMATTNTHLEYVILIAFPLQQWLHERASLLRYTYIACIVEVIFLGYYCSYGNCCIVWCAQGQLLNLLGNFIWRGCWAEEPISQACNTTPFHITGSFQFGGNSQEKIAYSTVSNCHQYNEMLVFHIKNRQAHSFIINTTLLKLCHSTCFGPQRAVFREYDR